MNTEKENGMVATMVAQLSSLHEGDQEVKYRHDFGKKQHYAVRPWIKKGGETLGRQMALQL
ncbi:hypothetical protein PC120_g20467 [Phytophthora cactorum]|nr:hypothetical protein PC120_g20467 [Phytophthora cactorum]